MIRKPILSTLLLIALTACNMVFAVPSDGSTGELPTMDPQIQIVQVVTQTFDAQTQIARAVEQTMAARVTDAPTETPSPTFTFTPTLTLTPEIPMVTVSLETNCRSGPGPAYDILGVLFVGQSAEVVGRSIYDDNWIIKLPSNPAITCWLWGYYATVVGDTSGLPALTPPPTPTPAANFTFSYSFWGISPGYQCLLFNVTNTGSTTWESFYITIHDITHGDTGSRPSNVFINYDTWCAVTGSQLDLMPGEMGTASGIMHMIHDASGENFEATLKLCSQDDLTGICLTKTISFIY